MATAPSSQFIFQTSNDVTGVSDLPQPPAEVTGGEVLQYSSTVQRPTQGAPLSSEVHAAEDEPDRGAGQEVDEVLADMDQNVVDVQDAGGDSSRVDSTEGKLLLREVLAVVSAVVCVDCVLLVWAGKDAG